MVSEGGGPFTPQDGATNSPSRCGGPPSPPRLLVCTGAPRTPRLRLHPAFFATAAGARMAWRARRLQPHPAFWQFFLLPSSDAMPRPKVPRHHCSIGTDAQPRPALPCMFILSYPILSYPILSYPTLSRRAAVAARRRPGRGRGRVSRARWAAAGGGLCTAWVRAVPCLLPWWCGEPHPGRSASKAAWLQEVD